MIFHPAIIALLLASFLITSMTLYSAYYGIQIQRKWDIQSGSELQLIMERRTYLISTLLTYVFAFEIISFFLYIYTADRLHTFFVGAMCAAGSLHVNAYGYPALILKMANLVLAGLWLTLNYTDNQAYDYPLIKKKYLFLLFLTPLLLAELILQAGYFLNLRPNIITSCCGSLFSIGQNSLVSDLASFPPSVMKGVLYLMTISNCCDSLFSGGQNASPSGLVSFSPSFMKWIFYLITVSTLAFGVRFYRNGRGGYLFSAMSVLTFLMSILSIISFISLYFYELPTHHCPFCILQREYGYIGYLLYATLFGSGITGMGVGILAPFRKRESLAGIIPSMQKRLVLGSLILLLIFVGIVTCRVGFTDFILEG